jgi:hypothetical protein
VAPLFGETSVSTEYLPASAMTMKLFERSLAAESDSSGSPNLPMMSTVKSLNSNGSSFLKSTS